MTAENDDFDAAFNEATASMESAPAAVEAPAAAPAAAEAPAPVESAPAAVEAPTETPAAATTTEAETPAAAPAEAEAPASMESAPASPTPATPAAAETPVVDPYEALSADDKAKLEGYKSEWPDIYEAETLRQKVEMQRVLSSFGRSLGEVLAPLFAQYQEATQDRVAQALTAAHPDYQDHWGQLASWVQKQPAYLQPAYAKVLNEGSPSEKIDLLGRYKAEMGIATVPAAKAAPLAAAPAAAPQATAPVDPKAAALEPVGSRRTSLMPAAADPTDFSGAWAEAVRALG